MMAPVSVTYKEHIPWRAQKTNYSWRPFTDVTIYGNSGKVMTFWALIDTGADHLMLDNQVAKSLGIDLTNCRRMPVMMASANHFCILFLGSALQLKELSR